MADKSWKANEREFAKWATEVWSPKTPFGRNDARTNSDDRDRNSDVDLIHTKLAIKQDGKQILAGVCAEITRRGAGFSSLYKWLKAHSTGLHNYLCINNKWVVCTREDFPFLYTLIQKPYETGFGLLCLYGASLINITSPTDFGVIVEKADQALRYGRTKKLFPIVVLREHRKGQLIVVDLEHIISPQAVLRTANDITDIASL